MIPQDILYPQIDEFHPLIHQILKLINPQSIVQIGIGAGSLSEKLLTWIEKHNGQLICIDLYSWNDQIKQKLDSPNLEFFEELSLDVLPTLSAADLYIINGDPNYFTLSNELKIIWEACQASEKPFLALVYGTSWPFDQRDAYSNPSMLPISNIHPYTWIQGVVPDYPETLSDGYKVDTLAFAIHAGEKQNGLLNAIWDFTEDKKEMLGMIKIPLFFGVTVIFSKGGKWSQKLTDLVKNYKDHDLTVSMEENFQDIVLELSKFQFEEERDAFRQQNESFDVEAFYKNTSEKKGKTSGLGLVSIIIPTFNRPALLKDAVTSVLQQTYQDIEVLIVNDGGQTLPKDFFQDSRVIYLETAHKGLPGARNHGIQASKGKYLAYLDDDDLLYPRHLEILLNAMHDNGYQVAYTDTFRSCRRKQGANYITYKKKLQKSFPIDPQEILIRNRLFSLCICHEKQCLDAVGVFDESLTRHEDWDLWIRLAQKYPFLHLPLPLSEYAIIPELTQMMTSWVGCFLNTALIIHQRYAQLAEHNFYVLSSQENFRNTLRFASLQQLELMSDKQIQQPEIKNTLLQILKNSLTGSEEDRRGANALKAYYESRIL